MIWTVRIGTLFPNLFPGPLGVSSIGKAMGKLWDLAVDDLRSFATDKHRTVDDAPMGGGGGMLIKCDIVDAWFSQEYNKNKRKIYLSPRGKLFKQSMVRDLIQQDLCILCGRFEGVDARVLEHWGPEELSLGDFVLHGGEVAAMALVEACARGIVVKQHSYELDSFSSGLLECDQYTRPAAWEPLDKTVPKVYDVPEVLISGDHEKIRRWRLANSELVTQQRRPDLWKEYLEEKK